MKRVKYPALIKHVRAQVKTNKIHGALKNLVLIVLISERTDSGLKKIICVIALCVSSRQLRKSSAASTS